MAVTTICIDRLPGSAGVSPAFGPLQGASTRERGRCPRPCKQPPSRNRPLPCKAHQTRLYVASFVPVFVRGDAFVDLFHRAGGTPALPGGLCACGTPALIFTPSPFPTLADPSRVFSNALVALRRPSCPFVEYSFLSVRASSSHYSSNCRTLLRIFSRLVLAESRDGSRARARSRLRTASSVRSR